MMIRQLSRQLLAILNILCLSFAINRPVYKIVLNSKGYAQFIQYDVDRPPVREFTLCVWVLVTSLESDQTIFTYVGNDDKRIMRLWLDSGGKQMRMSLDHDRVKSSASVAFTTHAWRDVCVSYQADYGAWALYVDAQLVLCEASRKVQGYEFPGQGRLIFGYGISENGSPTGLSGEIYGASMILYSTIKRNNTILNDLWNKQTSSRITKISDKHQQQNQYVILGDLQSDELKTVTPLYTNKDLKNNSLSFAAKKARYNMKVVPEYPMNFTSSNDNLSFDELVDNDKSKHKYFNQKYGDDMFKLHRESKKELTGSGTRDLPIVLEYETPPPITASLVDYSAKKLESQNNIAKDQNDHHIITISDVERPPPPEKNSKVYGQWTSSKFASSVLNYLKNINFNMYKKPPSTIPVVKLSDSHPYPSKLIYDIIRPPKNFKKNIHTEKYHEIEKRAINGPQINVEIINTDLSDNLKPPLKFPDPKLVEVTNRGKAKSQLKNVSQRSTEESESYESSEESLDVSQNLFEKRQINASLKTIERHRGNNLMDILPFVKSKEYFGKNRNDDTKITETNQVYLKSLSNSNKWHNVQSYNSDYTPRLIIGLESLAKSSNKKKNPYTKPSLYEPVHVNEVQSMIVGRALAKEVSSQANQNYFQFPFSESKHSLVSTRPKMKTTRNIAVKVVGNDEDKQTNSQNNFNRHVKLGNALNERFIIGYDEHEIKNTFLGGDDAVPDINRHRSKWNSNSSIGPRVCRNAELYVQEDESIVKSKILAQLERRNIGIEFVVNSYKECSMNYLLLKHKSLVLIDWLKTPVKLFGGASPEKTTDLCGFF